MKIRKYGVFAALAFVLLLTAALITSCVDPIGLGGLQAPKKGNDFQPPEGKSYVRLNFGDSNGRTIMPATIADAEGFTAFTVLFVNTSGSPTLDAGTTAYNYAQLTAKTYEVMSGQNYNITVNAYMSAYTGSGDVIAASGTAQTGVISTDKSVPIPLVGVTSGTGTGTFAWNVTYTGGFSGFNTATMGLEQIVGGSTFTTKDLKTATSGSDNTIASGQYRIVVTLDLDADHQPEVRTWVLHIYPGMTSTFIETLTVLNNIAYTVTFNNNNGIGGSGTASYKHGDNLYGATYPGNPTHNDGSTTFLGWYTSDGSATSWTGLTPINNSTYKIYRSLPLYARWGTPPTPPAANVGVTFSVTDVGSALAIDSNISGVTFTQGNIQSGTPYTLTVTGVPSGASISWRFDGEEVSTASTFVIEYNDGDSTTDKYLVVGPHTISVEITTTGNMTYSKNFVFTVDP